MLWLVVLGFNATLTAKVISWQSVTHVFPGFLTPLLTQLFFPKSPTTFLTCLCRERKVASIGDQTRNQQVMSPTRSPLSHPGGAKKKKVVEQEHNAYMHFLLFSQSFQKPFCPTKKNCLCHINRRLWGLGVHLVISRIRNSELMQI